MSSAYNTEGLPQIRAGTAQSVITPPVGVSLAGYFHERTAKRVRDDLLCRALVLETAGSRLALVSCDLISVEKEFVDQAKNEIEASLGIPPSNVLICATHTHTGPETRRGRVASVHEEWIGALPGRIVATVRAAATGMFPALLFPGRREETRLGSNRLGRKADGTEIFVKWGLEIKHWSPGRYTFIAELANDWFGYVPTTDQAQLGAYGAKPILSRRLDADGGRQIADAAQVLMWELRK